MNPADAVLSLIPGSSHDQLNEIIICRHGRSDPAALQCVEAARAEIQRRLDEGIDLPPDMPNFAGMDTGELKDRIESYERIRHGMRWTGRSRPGQPEYEQATERMEMAWAEVERRYQQRNASRAG